VERCKNCIRGKPRHGHSQGLVKWANRDIETCKKN